MPFGDNAVRPDNRKTLLVLKLDHLGDFLIGLPALIEIRKIFQDYFITLVCGSWNLRTALDVGVADEVRTLDFFPENVRHKELTVLQGVERFREICAGRFDIAIDLRVDDDTRLMLREVDAGLRCGIGTRTRFDFLDIALPPAPRVPQPIPDDVLEFKPSAFHSRMPLKTSFYHETDFRVTDTHMIYGPYCPLPLGRLRAEFGVHLSTPSWMPSRKVAIVMDVAQGSPPGIVAFNRIRRLPPGETDLAIAMEFTNDDPLAIHEFRLFTGGRPALTRLRFVGVRIEVARKAAPRARLEPSELHVGEQLSLLVKLVAERVRPLYPADLLGRIAGTAGTPQIPDGVRCIVIAPISNSQVRDWPIGRYARLVGLLLAQTRFHVVLVGSAIQTARLDEICQENGHSPRLINLGGRTNWAGLTAVLGRADLVIANNSGIAHLAAACGRPTLAIYSGSHQPREWGPRGDRVRTVTEPVACSPCGHETLDLCPFDHICMTRIEPERILNEALSILDIGRTQSQC